jgi:hypothetical protein
VRSSSTENSLGGNSPISSAKRQKSSRIKKCAARCGSTPLARRERVATVSAVLTVGSFFGVELPVDFSGQEKSPRSEEQ